MEDAAQGKVVGAIVDRMSLPETVCFEFAFVRYSAACPICGGIVEIHEGRRAFPDRLIGRCRLAAREHLFSFDPALRTGYPLQIPGQRPNDSRQSPLVGVNRG